MISEEYSGLPVAVYKEGSFFGDIEVFKNMKRYFSVNSLSKLDLLALDKSDFKRIFFRQFPVLGYLFLTHIEKKWHNIQEILELIGDFFDPKYKNQEGIELTKSIKKDGEMINKMSRKNSILAGSILKKLTIR
jgi:CRP-like cAMP-binding protein